VNALDSGVRPRSPASNRPSPAAARPEILLTMASYYGTLAAARSLGRRGIRVVVADGDPLAPARWSRHVARTVDCPHIEAEPTRFIDWLLSLGAREPGRVLFTSSDCIAWMFARHRAALARHFRIYLPSVDSVYTLLNKWRLYEVCVDLGIDVPPTWLPSGVGDLSRVRREARFPVVIKPQTQILLFPHQKGRVVHAAGELNALYSDFVSATAHAPMLLELDPHVGAPLVQTFVDTTTEGVYSLSGFIDDTGELFVVRASRKLLQWPPRLGVGLCFEGVEVRQSLAADVARLCRHIGYFGPFEVEFVRSGDRYQLIDFNPRFFSQMGFDVSRGLDLPHLVYLAATGERRELERAVRQARQRNDKAPTGVYCHRIDLEIALRLQRWAGQISRKDCERWRVWLARNRVTDAVMDPEDWAPGLAEVTAALVRRAVHPRSTWRFANEK
jgi:predicted ATP-grasp superfamily ATP-dependent carboligase